MAVGNHPVIDALTRVGDHWMDRLIWYATILLLGSIIFSTALMFTAVVLLFALWIVAMVSRRTLLVRRTPFDIPYLTFIVARTLAIPLSIDPAVSVEAFRTEIPFYLLFFLFAGTLRPGRPAEIRFLLQVLVASAVIAALIGVGKVSLGITPRGSSTTSGFYTLGLYLCIILAIVVCSGSEIITRRWLWFAASTIIIAGIVSTFDRLHWAGMLAVLIVAGIFWERRLLAYFLAGAVAVVTLVPPVHTRFMESVHILSNTTGRDVLWRGALMIIDRHPLFGFGLRTFHLIFPLQAELPDQHVGSWHNDYLQVYMESGLVALLPFLWMIAAICIRGIRQFRAGLIPLSYRRTTAGLLISAILLFVVGGFLDTHVGILFKFLFPLLGLLLVSTEASGTPATSVETN